MISRIRLLGDAVEAEKLRGFALSQLWILRNTMEFQGLKQYTRVVRFSDGSYVRAFSCFGLDSVTVFVPPISVPRREVVEVEEAIYIAIEPCEVALEVPEDSVWVCNCETTDDVAYDTENSDETVDREGEATVIVIDGCGPFNWSVEGTGYSLEHAVTGGRTNTLYADETACGPATITVTDECEDSCIGYVRGTEGEWVFKEFGCIMPGTGIEVGSGSGPPWVDYEYISGYKKQTQKTYWMGVRNYTSCAEDDCCSACNDGDCSEGSCQECIGDGRIPCLPEPTELLPDRSSCWKNILVYYWEWEC